MCGRSDLSYGKAVTKEEPTTDLARHIEETPLVDTHEHLRRESEWLDDGPDILQDLFGNYVAADLHTAGASAEAMRRLVDASDPDIAARFRGIEAAWQATQFTGYGEAVRLIAGAVYGLDELTADGLAAAAGRTPELRRPGARWRLRGAEAVLRLRALRSSGDFDQYWAFHEARQWQRTHQQRYADGQMPTLRQPPNEQSPPLRIVR